MQKIRVIRVKNTVPINQVDFYFRTVDWMLGGGRVGWDLKSTFLVEEGRGSLKSE